MPFEKRRLPLYLVLYSVWLAGLALATGIVGDGISAWSESWIKWDAHWYERIWLEGYPKADPRAMVFPPGYSGLVGAIAWATRLEFHTAALMTNLVSYFAYAAIAAETMAVIWAVPPVAVFVFSLSAPAGYFVLTSYSDAVFCFALWLLIGLGLKRSSSRLLAAAEVLLLVALPWLRLTGYALAAWLLVRRLSALAVFVSLGAWLGLNAMIGGDAFYFLQAQKLFLMPEGDFLDGVIYTFTGLLSGLNGEWTPYLQFHLLPAVYLTVLVAIGFWALVKKQGLIGVTILSILIVSHNQSFWRSAVRYDLPLFPILSLPLLLLARGRMRIFAYAVFGMSVFTQFLLQARFAGIFKDGGWAF